MVADASGQGIRINFDARVEKEERNKGKETRDTGDKNFLRH